jgi:hypothetical protein
LKDDISNEAEIKKAFMIVHILAQEFYRGPQTEEAANNAIDTIGKVWDKIQDFGEKKKSVEWFGQYCFYKLAPISMESIVIQCRNGQMATDGAGAIVEIDDILKEAQVITDSIWQMEVKQYATWKKWEIEIDLAVVEFDEGPRSLDDARVVLEKMDEILRITKDNIEGKQWSSLRQYAKRKMETVIKKIIGIVAENVADSRVTGDEALGDLDHIWRLAEQYIDDPAALQSLERKIGEVRQQLGRGQEQSPKRELVLMVSSDKPRAAAKASGALASDEDVGTAFSSTSKAAISGAPAASSSKRGSSEVASPSGEKSSGLALPTDDWDRFDKKQKSDTSSIPEVEDEAVEPVEQDQSQEVKEVAETEEQSPVTKAKSKKTGKSQAKNDTAGEAEEEQSGAEEKESSKKTVQPPHKKKPVADDEKPSAAKTKSKKDKKDVTESEEELQAEDEVAGDQVKKKKSPTAKKGADGDTAKQPDKGKPAPKGESPAAEAKGKKLAKKKKGTDQAKAGDQSKSADGAPTDPSESKDPKKQGAQLKTRQTTDAKAGDGAKLDKATPDAKSEAPDATSKRRARRAGRLPTPPNGPQISIKTAAPSPGSTEQVSKVGQRRAGRRRSLNVSAANPAALGSRGSSVGVAAASPTSDRQPLQPPSAAGLRPKNLPAGMANGTFQTSDRQPFQPLSAAGLRSAVPSNAVQKATAGTSNRVLIQKFATKKNDEFSPEEPSDRGGFSGLVTREESQKPLQLLTSRNRSSSTGRQMVPRQMVPGQLGVSQQPTDAGLSASGLWSLKVVNSWLDSVPKRQKSSPGVEKAGTLAKDRLLKTLNRKKNMSQPLFSAKGTESRRPEVMLRKSSARGQSPTQLLHEGSQQTGPSLVRRTSDEAEAGSRGRVSSKRSSPVANARGLQTSNPVDSRLPLRSLGISMERNLPVDWRKMPREEEGVEEKIPTNIWANRELRRNAIGVSR